MHLHDHIRETRFRKGYSLLELMVVIVIMGIAAAAILPEMKGTYEDALLRSASRELVDALTLSWSRSVTLNQAHRLRLDAKGKYQVEQLVIGPRAEKQYAPVKDAPGCAGSLDERITVRLRKGQPGPDPEEEEQAETAPPISEPALQDAVEFLPDGTTEAAQFLLRDRYGFGLSVTLNPITSRVRIASLGKDGQ